MQNLVTNFRFYIISGLLLVALFFVSEAASVRNAILFLLGYLLALTFIKGKIGFTFAWRQFILKREATSMINQIIMLLMASLLVLPMLVNVENTQGNIAPVGLSLFVGAWLFGVGMQLGDGCGSGTLLGAGSGSIHSLICLIFFIVGSVLGSAHLHWWLQFNILDPSSLITQFALPTALILQITLVGIFLGLCYFIAKHYKITLEKPNKRQLLTSLIVALLVALALFVSGRMWGITFGYTLWGAKIATTIGISLENVPFWNWSFPKQALTNNIFTDITSVMNLGMLLAAISLVLLKPINPPTTISKRQLIAAIIGGLLMGYGARLAFGCNIGAYFSGIASGSMHGWLWLIFAFTGTYLGIKLRPYFQLT